MKQPVEKLTDEERREQLYICETRAALSMVGSAISALPPVCDEVVNAVYDFLESSELAGVAIKFERLQRPPPRCYRKVSISKKLRWAVFERDNFTCQYCRSRQFLVADHKHPECKGGETVFENLITCCETCNQKKGRKTYEEFTSCKN